MRDNHVLRIRYIDVGGLETEREVEPQHVVVGPNGSYLTAWCHLRGDDRVFRMDRITRAERDAVAAASAARRPGADRRRPRDEAAGVGAASRRSPAKLRHRAVARLRDGGCIPPLGRVIGKQKETPMTNPAPGTLAWFEVATSDPDGAEKFYGSLFDWTFEADGPAASGGMDYRNIKASGADGPIGGIFGTGGQVPDHAVFYILVADVEATCADAEQLGGSVVSKHLDPGPGRPDVRLPARPVGQPVRRLHPAGGLMAPDAKGTSPPEQSGGDDARDLYDELTDDLLYDPAIGRATMMGYPCVRLAGRFLASFDDKAGCLVVKLPRERVTELVAERPRRPVRPRGQGLPRVGVDPHGRPAPVADRARRGRRLRTEGVDRLGRSCIGSGHTTIRSPPT